MEQRDALANGTAQELLATYQRHLGDAPNNVLIRHRFVFYLSHQREARLLEPFKAMFDLEPDPVIRSLIVLGIAQSAPNGDPSTLEFLQRKLETESNIRWTRPTLEMAIQWLRDGSNNSE